MPRPPTAPPGLARDMSRRHPLNCGRTFGHVLEHATDFALRHGADVETGTVFTGRLDGALGRIGRSRVEEYLYIVRKPRAVRWTQHRSPLGRCPLERSPHSFPGECLQVAVLSVDPVIVGIC